MKGLKTLFRSRTLRTGMFFSLFIETLGICFLLVAFRILESFRMAIFRSFPNEGGLFKLLEFVASSHMVVGLILLCIFYTFRNINCFRKR